MSDNETRYDDESISSVFDDLALFASQQKDTRKDEERRLKDEKTRLKRERNILNIGKALEAFESENWIVGLRFAEKTDMKDSRIQYWMGRFHEDGYLFNRSPNLAANWYEKAAEQGCTEANRRLGSMHIEGYSASFANNAEWVSWKRCRESAERGNAAAQVTWGNIMAFEGKDKEAGKWHVRAERQNDPKALYCLGRTLESGHLIDDCEDIALEYYQRAAELGDFGSMLRLKYKFNQKCNLIMPSDEELKSDFIKGKDGIYHKRVKTGPWLPVYARWMDNEIRDAVDMVHEVRTKGMTLRHRIAALGDRIFGKDGPEHEGYGTGALQKWADKMVREGKDPHNVSLLDWFKGAPSAFDYHMCERTFDELMKEARHDSFHMMRCIIERIQDCMPQLRNMSRARILETIRQRYYTIRYAPYGIPALGDME